MRDAIEYVVDGFYEETFRFHPGISTKAAAELLGVHEQTIRNWVHGGRLKAYGVPSNWRFRVPDLIKCLRHEKN